MINLSDDINVLLGIVNSGYDKNHLILTVDKFSSVIKMTRDEIINIISLLQSKKDIFNSSYDDRDLIVNFRDLYSYGLKFIISRRNNSITFTFSSKFIREYGENHYIHIIQRFFNEIKFEIDARELHQRLEVGYIEIALDFFGLSMRNKIKDLRTKVISNYIKERSPEKKRTIIINRKYDGKYNHLVSNENDKDTFIQSYLEANEQSHIKIYDKLTNAFYERTNENHHWIKYFSSVLYDLSDENSIKFMDAYTRLSGEEKTIVFNKMIETQSIIRLEYSINNKIIETYANYKNNPLNPDYILITNALTNKHLMLKYLIENIWNITYRDRSGKYKLLPLFNMALDFIDSYEPEEDNGINPDTQIELRKNIMKSTDYASRTRGCIKSIIEQTKYYASQGGNVDEIISIISETSDILISGLDDIYSIKSQIIEIG
ncbi:MAG: hypothetical protein ACP59X_10345 [Solidesulfovibrio sp. DCME]|uniref:hypothetical protein n=1 Tax=Solidesulfovibrio sp. DCME TaxID=3447380 RepID=UPI003D120DAB